MTTPQPQIKRHFRAFTLIELIVAITIVAIPIVAVGILLSASARSWETIYDDTNSPIRLDAIAVMSSLQNFGRQANITNYQVYSIENSDFTVAVPQSGESVAIGQAVEFRYWGDTFDLSGEDEDALNTENTGTHYALYYLDGDVLKVDFGKVVDDVGAVSGENRIETNLLSTQILANDVDLTKTTRLFSHTVTSGQGNGCINTELTLTSDEGITIEIKFATMLRSAWPR